jgi:hypothetical protein
MNYQLREYLIDLCAMGKTIAYQELSNECKLGLDMSSPADRSKIAEQLGTISIYEHHHNRPLLTAVVIAKRTHIQGDGFFKLGEQLGLGDWKILKKDSFDIVELNKCFEFWSNTENYNNFRNINYV